MIVDVDVDVDVESRVFQDNEEGGPTAGVTEGRRGSKRGIVAALMTPFAKILRLVVEEEARPTTLVEEANNKIIVKAMMLSIGAKITICPAHVLLILGFQILNFSSN